VKANPHIDVATRAAQVGGECPWCGPLPGDVADADSVELVLRIRREDGNPELSAR